MVSPGPCLAEAATRVIRNLPPDSALDPQVGVRQHPAPELQQVERDSSRNSLATREVLAAVTPGAEVQIEKREPGRGAGRREWDSGLRKCLLPPVVPVRADKGIAVFRGETWKRMRDFNHPGSFSTSVSRSSLHSMFASEVQGARGREEGPGMGPLARGLLLCPLFSPGQDGAAMAQGVPRLHVRAARFTQTCVHMR